MMVRDSEAIWPHKATIRQDLCIWVRSRNCGCLVTRLCYQLIAKRGNKTATVSDLTHIKEVSEIHPNGSLVKLLDPGTHFINDFSIIIQIRWKIGLRVTPLQGIIQLQNFAHVTAAHLSWASYQIRKIAGCACAGNAGNVFPCRRFQRKPLVSDPGMHHGTCVTHVPWCMSGSLTCGDRENVPGIPGACAPAILRIWQEAHAMYKILITS